MSGPAWQPPPVGSVWTPTKAKARTEARTIIAAAASGFREDCVWWTLDGSDIHVCTPGYWRGWVKRTAACQDAVSAAAVAAPEASEAVGARGGAAGAEKPLAGLCVAQDGGVA